MQPDDLLAQKRFEFAAMLKERGDISAAVSLYKETLELAPKWAEVHFALAEALEETGEFDEASQHYATYLRLAETDVMGAEIRLALLGNSPVPDVLPPAYVSELFDQYAERFEGALLGQLEYRAPQQLREAVELARPFTTTGEKILDLGCGTGLGGEAFLSRAASLYGVDLSAGMIAEARRKGIYTELREGEIVASLQEHKNAFDLIIAADVLVYLGDLRPLFENVCEALSSEGLFAFTVQKGDGEGFILGRECRYSHHPSYIADLVEETGFRLISMVDGVSRYEAGKAVESLICVVQKPICHVDLEVPLLALGPKRPTAD